MHIPHRYRVAALVAGLLALVVATLYAVSPAFADRATPGVPAAPRIQTDAFTPNQLCSAGTPGVSTKDTIVLAASPTPFGKHPTMRATFEISGAGGEPLITRTSRIWPSGRVLALTLDPNALAPGTYRFRLRAEQGNAVSGWTTWCGFAVNG
ncbi:hypothetical protein GCM10023194_67360 [Planotetraspora phitsanulokensis]|uniref:CopC domain-containing protein n=1 Tax=Planotetraspora phitsanulokensis TaxID=575192 RepID=A0A8J3U7X4_9ACTN|nr:hypothetical protein [Planotetraspora phitsanulokensis]GII39701.1 hypothetical protein Pph01_47040 [Planotetraspora phitsanulokensis]